MTSPARFLLQTVSIGSSPRLDLAGSTAEAGRIERESTMNTLNIAVTNIGQGSLIR
ncbi:hypothetical protein METHPM2_2010006 [Pseudomonas sp. PM2]